jgi:SAM-dependent methyltransferase
MEGAFIMMSDEDYREWINKQKWYQTIELNNGLITKGKFPTNDRIRYLEGIDFKGKQVLDVGCNSGQYCLYAKKRGALKVVGIDVDEMRLEQAKILSDQEGADIIFEKRSIYELSELGKFDIVFCIAVLTEITDLSMGIQNLKNAIGDYAFLEMDIARQHFYSINPERWIRNIIGRNQIREYAEVRQTKRGDWIISPSLKLLQKMFGSDFQLIERGHGVRYQMIDVYRKK